MYLTVLRAAGDTERVMFFLGVVSMKSKSNVLINAILLLALFGCWWVGWSDSGFIKTDVSQEEVRESIRLYIRRGVQISIQFIIPGLIIGYYLRSLKNRFSAEG